MDNNNSVIICLSLRCKIEQGVIQNNTVDVWTDKGIISILIPLPVTSIGYFELMDKIKQDPIAKDATVKTTTFFDSQAIRLENSLRKILSEEQKKELEGEMDELKEENSDLLYEGREILSLYGFGTEEFDPTLELPDEISEELSEEELERYEDICEFFNSNDLRKMEIEELLDIKVDDIKLEENFCNQKPEVQSKLDEIIRSASFSALYNHFTAYKSSKDCAYEYDTKKIMELLSLEFCDVVNGEIDFTNTDLYYQALKDMVYELYKSIPGEECKED